MHVSVYLVREARWPTCSVVERRTPEREVGGSILTQVAMFCPRARYIYLPKILVIPRKQWLRPDRTEILLTGTLSKNESKRNYLGRSEDKVDVNKVI